MPYTNGGTKAGDQTRKKQHVDMLDHWQSWVTGCTATLPRNARTGEAATAGPLEGGGVHKGEVSAGEVEDSAETADTA